jgi:hypothetical protein
MCHRIFQLFETLLRQPDQEDVPSLDLKQVFFFLTKKLMKTVSLHGWIWCYFWSGNFGSIISGVGPTAGDVMWG